MTGLIILAAGKSSRLGFPKQTLLYKGKTLLELAIRAGLKSRCSPLAVILGANAETIEKGIQKYSINIINNPNWSEGMASSISAGIRYFQNNNEIDSIVIMLCDQPFVTYTIIDNLLHKKQETGNKIVASSYNEVIGVPALFDRSLFNKLLLLQGQEGAKKIFTNHPDDIAFVPFEKGGIDIDTITDYENLIKKA